MWDRFKGQQVGVFFRDRFNLGVNWFKFEEANNNGIFVSPPNGCTELWKLRFYPWGKIDWFGLKVEKGNSASTPAELES